MKASFENFEIKRVNRNVTRFSLTTTVEHDWRGNFLQIVGVISEAQRRYQAPRNAYNLGIYPTLVAMKTLTF